MIDLTKGEYKIYLYNDPVVFNQLKEAVKFDDRFINWLFNAGAKGLQDIPYYFRIKNNKFSGRNSTQYHGCDGVNQIEIDAIELIRQAMNSLAPSDLFEM